MEERRQKCASDVHMCWHNVSCVLFCECRIIWWAVTTYHELRVCLIQRRNQHQSHLAMQVSTKYIFVYFKSKRNGLSGDGTKNKLTFCHGSHVSENVRSTSSQWLAEATRPSNRACGSDFLYTPLCFALKIFLFSFRKMRCVCAWVRDV